MGSTFDVLVMTSMLGAEYVCLGSEPLIEIGLYNGANVKGHSNLRPNSGSENLTNLGICLRSISKE